MSSLAEVAGGGAALPATLSNITVGAWYPGTQHFPGTIDDVRIYNRALSATEVKQLRPRHRHHPPQLAWRVPPAQREPASPATQVTPVPELHAPRSLTHLQFVHLTASTFRELVQSSPSRIREAASAFKAS